VKEGFRQSMSWLHTWLGLVVGWILFLVYLTGTLGFVDKEIDYWMTPDRPFFADAGTQQQQLTLAQQRLQQVAPTAERWTVQMIGGREAPSLDISWTEPAPSSTARGTTHKETLDPATGQPIDYSARTTGGGQVLYKMHYFLAYIPQDKAILFIMACTLVMFAAMVTGIIVHKNIFKDFFTFRPSKGQRSWLDGHNLLSVSALPFHLIVTYSGFLFYVTQFMPTVPNLLYSEDGGRSAIGQVYQGVYPYPAPELPQAAGMTAPLASLATMIPPVDALWGEGMATAVEVIHPGDANARAIFRPLETQSIAYPETAIVVDGVNGAVLEDFRPTHYGTATADHVMKGLHKGLFANWFLRVLYLFMGVGGTMMIGTGLLLWSNARKTRLIAAKKPLHSQQPHLGIWLVDRLNLGTVIGMPVAVAAYFWANRLLPVELATRAEWEVHAMYLTMLALFLYPAIRPLDKARIDMLWLCAASYLLLPGVNALTTTRGLSNSIAQGDWIMAGFDLTSLFCGCIAVAFAIKLHKRSTVPVTKHHQAEGISKLAAS
jgi:uncharacterized iron-regulated membrane protein